MQTDEGVSAASAPASLKSPLTIARDEWKIWLACALLSFFLASILMSGWKEGLLPNLAYPYSYSGDFLFHSWLAQRAMEGWIFENARSGYPFGSTLYDFPNADAGSILLQKAFGMALGSYYAGLNLYFLLGFPVTAAVTYCVARSFGLSKAYAAATAALYTFVPFHILRLGHIFYTWYFVAPIYFFLGYSLAFGSEPNAPPPSTTWRKLGVFTALAVQASFGIYFDAFGLIIIGLSAIASRVHFGDYRRLARALFYTGSILFGALVNTAPTLIYDRAMGPNPEVAARSPAESETYGLKLVQLLYPRKDHRVRALRQVEQNYSQAMPLVNENRSSALGLIGSIGLLLLAWSLFKASAGGAVEQPTSYFALCALVLFAFGTIGGLGVIFADLVSPLLRAWNRISVFIAFPAIAAALLAVQNWFSARRLGLASCGCAALVTVIGLLDQSTAACQTCRAPTKTEFDMDRNFVGNIESLLPKASAVYQLPYMPFPEPAPVARLTSYELVSGFIHSTSLRWSYAGMKGREGDLFYRGLAEEPLARQVEVVEKLGFGGIYVDKRGFADNGAEVVGGLTQLLGAGPRLSRADGAVVFFELPPAKAVDFSGLTARQIMQTVGYYADRLGRRQHQSLAQGIDFSSATLPDFVLDIKGLATPEPWGRWSDARLDPAIRIDFTSPLPAKFTMALKAQPFVPNIDQDIVVKVGSHEQSLRLKEGVNEVQLTFDLGGDAASSIEFHPRAFASPAELGINGDTRKLGLGFMQLRIVE